MLAYDLSIARFAVRRKLDAHSTRCVRLLDSVRRCVRVVASTPIAANGLRALSLSPTRR